MWARWHPSRFCSGGWRAGAHLERMIRDAHSSCRALLRLGSWLVALGLGCQPGIGNDVTVSTGAGGSTGTGIPPTGPNETRPGVEVDDTTAEAFEHDILPIFLDHCVTCHGGVRQLGHPPMSLQARDTAAFALGDGHTEQSLLYLRVTSTDPLIRMPLGGA